MIMRIFFLLLLLIAFPHFAWASTYKVSIRNISETNFHAAECVEKRTLCLLTMKIPAPAGGYIDAGIIFEYDIVDIQFKKNGRYLSISDQGQKSFYERIGKSGLHKKIKVYMPSPMAQDDPEIPGLLVVRPSNALIAELEVFIEPGP